MIHKIPSLIKKLQPYLVPVLLVIAIILIYAWFASPGKSNEWELSTNYFDLLARGFLNSNLFLPLEPDPRILALPNPYDPSARDGVEIYMDLSLYQEKYYLYWGPVPALMLSGIYLFFPGRISDLYLALLFVSGVFAVQVLFLFTLWRRFFRHLPVLLLYASILLSGLAGPLMLLRHWRECAKVYQVSITGGQFFFMSGLLLALTAISDSSISTKRLTLAAILWALAIGTRQVLAVPIGFLMLLLAGWHLQRNAWCFKKTVQILPAALPLVFGFVCLGWYNWARFGSISETGFQYALAGDVNMQERSYALFSPVYILPNLYNYLLNPFVFTSKFPFVVSQFGIESFSSISASSESIAESMTGLLYTFPFSLFAGLPFFGSPRKLFLSSLDARERAYWNLITYSLSGSFLMSFGLLLLFFWAGMRYTEDFLPSLTILSVIGLWQGYQSLDAHPVKRRFYSVLGVSIAGLSILINVLLAISTNSNLVRLISDYFQSP